MAKHIRGRYEGSISHRPSGHWRVQTSQLMVIASPALSRQNLKH